MDKLKLILTIALIACYCTIPVLSRHNSRLAKLSAPGSSRHIRGMHPSLKIIEDDQDSDTFQLKTEISHKEVLEKPALLICRHVIVTVGSNIKEC